MDKSSTTPASLIEAVRYFADPDVCLSFMVALRWPDDPEARKLANARAKAAANNLARVTQSFARVLRGARRWRAYELPLRTRTAAPNLISR